MALVRGVLVWAFWMSMLVVVLFFGLLACLDEILWGDRK